MFKTSKSLLCVKRVDNVFLLFLTNLIIPCMADTLRDSFDMCVRNDVRISNEIE